MEHGCWCEVSCLLAYAGIPGLWLLTDNGEVNAFDHVDAAVPAGATVKLNVPKTAAGCGQ